jgi:carboxymethylenebutenolidase
VTPPTGSQPLYVALPPGAQARPGLLLLPPIFGVEPVIEGLVDRYAARGFVTLAPDQFWRDPEPGVMPRTDAGRERALARAKRVDVDAVVDDVRAAVETLRAMPRCNGRVAVLGLCFGGRYAFLAAARLDIDAAAAFHGTQIGLSLADAPTVRVPLSLQFGAVDPITPPAEVDAIRAALATRSDAEVTVHPGATHNFSLPGVPGYDAQVAADSERRVFTLFDRLDLQAD